MSVQESDPEILIEAFTTACRDLDITHDQASAIIGTSPAILKKHKDSGFDPKSTIGHACIQLIAIYRSLYAISGGNKLFMKHWMHTENKAFDRVPLEVMLNEQGLQPVNDYLKGMLSKNDQYS